MRWRNGYSVMLKLSDAHRKFPLISGHRFYTVRRPVSNIVAFLVTLSKKKIQEINHNSLFFCTVHLVRLYKKVFLAPLFFCTVQLVR